DDEARGRRRERRPAGSSDGVNRSRIADARTEASRRGPPQPGGRTRRALSPGPATDELHLQGLNYDEQRLCAVSGGPGFERQPFSWRQNPARARVRRRGDHHLVSRAGSELGEGGKKVLGSKRFWVLGSVLSSRF